MGNVNDEVKNVWESTLFWPLNPYTTYLNKEIIKPSYGLQPPNRHPSNTLIRNYIDIKSGEKATRQPEAT